WCRGDGDEGGGGVRWWCWLSGDDGAMMMKMGVVAIVVERRRNGEGIVVSWWWRWRSAGRDGDGMVAVVGVKIDVVVAGILPEVAGATPKNGRMYVCGRLGKI
ncbi:hypothetical protein Tco_0376485, partial [Tanacetum coccineum]